MMIDKFNPFLQGKTLSLLLKVESKYMNYHMKYLVPIMKPKNCNIYSMIYVGIDFWTSCITIDKCLSSTCL
jgi:hypothetical protein